MNGPYIGCPDGSSAGKSLPHFLYAQTITEPWPVEKVEETPRVKRLKRRDGASESPDQGLEYTQASENTQPARGKKARGMMGLGRSSRSGGHASGKKSAGHPEQTPCFEGLNGVHVELGIECGGGAWQIHDAAQHGIPAGDSGAETPTEATADMSSQQAFATSMPLETDQPGEPSEEGVKATGLFNHEYALVRPMVKLGYAYPRVFVLLVQIADAGEVQKAASLKDRPLWVSTETLIRRARAATEDMRRNVYQGLKTAHTLGLISVRELQAKDGSKDSARSHVCALTQEGKRFLMAGVKTRNTLRRVSPGWGIEEICAQADADAIEELKAQMEEGLEDYQRLSGGELPSRKGTTVLSISRSELASAIQTQTLQRARDMQQTVAPVWAGLLR